MKESQEGWESLAISFGRAFDRECKNRRSFTKKLQSFFDSMVYAGFDTCTVDEKDVRKIEEEFELFKYPKFR